MADNVADEVGGVDLRNGLSIYYLIEANNLDAIRSLLDPLTLRSRQSIVCQRVYNKTLLGLACELCFRDIVKYLLDECEADISERYSRGCTWLSPLRVSVNKLDVPMLIVLVRRGAFTADTRETIKCADYVLKNDYFSIFTILSIYTYAVESMKDIPRLPILNYLVANKNVKYTEFFFKALASGEIDSIKTPLYDCMSPRVINDSEENALCMAILNGKSNAEHFLLNYRVFSLKDYVRALELCGARFIVFQSELDKGVLCWKRALRIRTENFFGVSDKFEKLPTRLGFEFSSEEELDFLKSHYADIYVQALIVFIRLLSPSGELLRDAFLIVSQHPVFHNNFCQAIKILAEFSEFPDLPLYGHVSSVRKSIEYFGMLLHRHFCCDPSDLRDLLTKLNKIINSIMRFKWEELLGYKKEFYRIIYIRLLKRVLYFLTAVNKFEQPINDIVNCKDISDLMKRHSSPYPTTLLHISIDKNADFSVVSFIINCSDDVNCTDSLGNTPLHMVSFRPAGYSDLLPLVNLLTDVGGNINATNIFAVSPLMMLKNKGIIRNPLKAVK